MAVGLERGLAVILGAAICSTAMAAPFDEAGVVELLPVGDLVGDGATTSTLHLLALNAEGLPHVGAKLKVTVSQGEAGEPVEVGGGIYALPFTPPAVGAEQSVDIAVKVRTADRRNIEVSDTVVVRPAASERIGVSVNPERIILSQDAAATLSFQVPLGKGDEPKAEDLLVRVSSGEVSGIVSLGAGKFSARYTPPQVNYPHLAVITVVDRRDPHGLIGHVVVPLQGKVDYPVTTVPGSSAILRVAGRDFGPTTVGGDGRVSIPIVVPPGVDSATLVTIVDGGPQEETLDLRVPEIRRLQLFPLQQGVPSDDALGIPVRVLVLDPTGEPDENAALNLSATAGRLSSLTHIGGGIYEATFTPPDGRTRMAATIQATVPGGAKQTDDVEITLVPALPDSLTLSTEPTELSSAGTGVKVFARLSDSEGTGLPGRTFRVQVAGASLKGEMQDLKGGDYRQDLTADQGTDVSVQVVAVAAPSGNALRRVVVLPRSEVMPADGVTSQSVTVLTTDEFGYPVPNVEVRLSLDGAGSLPSTVTTDGSGYGQVFYTAGGSPGVVGIEAEAAGHRTSVPLLLGLEDATLDLPVSGSAADIRISNAWANMQGEVLVSREGAAAAPVTAGDTSVGTLASLKASAEPSVVAPGGSVTVNVVALDEAGKGVSGETLDFLATGGARFGVLSDKGNGDYSTVLTVPADITGTIKVSVMSGSGVTTLLEIAVSDSVASGDPWSQDTGAWGDKPASETAEVVADPPPPETPVATTTPTTAPTKPARPQIDRPWMRTQLGFVLSTYAYSQTPTLENGGLLPSELSWGGGEGGAALPLGVELISRGHVPDLPYIGWHASFRYTRYTVSSPSFSEDAVDNLFAVRLNLRGRYPIKIKQEELSIGARVGFRYDDFVTFRGCDTPGCQVTYQPLQVPGLDVGVEVGAEFWKMYANVAATGGFAYGSTPYAVGVDANVGWNITENLFIDAGFGWQQRQADLEGAESGLVRGTLDDQTFAGTLGVGISL